MKVELEITVSSSAGTMSVSEVVNEGQPVVLESEGDSKWNMRVVPNEVIQITEVKGDTDDCPICGEPVDEIALMNHVGETIEMDRVCVGDSGLEDEDFLLFYHRQES